MNSREAQRIISETFTNPFDESRFAFFIRNLIVMDLIHREKPVPENFKECLFKLREYGIIEWVGRGKGTRYLLSRRFYRFLGEKGTYTRKRGLDWDTNKALLLKHIKENKKTGSKLSELREVLPVLSRNQIQGLLREMKQDKVIFCKGRTKGARWYPFEKSK